MANAWITHVAMEIGVAGDELDSAIAYAVMQDWFEVSNLTGRTSLTPAGEGAGESS